MKESYLIGSICAVIFSFISLPSHAIPVSGQGTWESTLEGRDLDGNASTYEAYYDTTLNITWLTVANSYGLKTWNAATTWVSNLDVNGVTGWRLPTMVDTGTPGCNYSTMGGTDCGYNVQTGNATTTVYSEMASLFYDTLGNLAYYDTSGNSPQPGWGLTNTGPFIYFQTYWYWSELEYALDPSRAWAFSFGSGGFQGDGGGKANPFYALAVRAGDVSAVPVPAAVWLFGTGLLGLVGMARRK